MPENASLTLVSVVPVARLAMRTAGLRAVGVQVQRVLADLEPALAGDLDLAIAASGRDYVDIAVRLAEGQKQGRKGIPLAVRWAATPAIR